MIGWKRLRTGLRRAGALGLAGGLAAVGAVAALVALDARYPFPTRVLEPPRSGRVLAADGALLARRVAHDEQWRRPIALEEMGSWLPMATIAVEDRRFRSHRGVDLRAVARATVRNVSSGRVREGASTLTMQLVGMTLPQPRTLAGKAVEAFRALQVERLLTKDEILERYLNHAPYGRNLAGVASASQHWFGKEPRDLALDEAALLAGLPQAPSRLRPDRHPERALARRRNVLDEMLRCGMIDERARDHAAEAPLALVPTETGEARPDHAFHVSSRALEARAAGGRTTVDPTLQYEVERVARAHGPHFPPGTEIAICVIDVESASVAALVGSADPSDPIDGQVDGTRARRSPGSTLKPFVYAAAFEAGRLTPDSIVADTPIELDGWRPENFEGGFMGPVAVDEALRRSLNIPALRVAQAVGLERCVGVLEAAGVDLRAEATSRSGLSLVTGGAGVRLVDLTNAYATLARGGRHAGLRFFRDEPRPTPTRVLSESTCASLFTILSSDARAPQVRGGASHVEAPEFMWKTGTSSGHVDAWAVGHDHRRAIGVWVGRFDGAGHPAFVGREAAEPILAELFAAPR